MTRRAAFGLCLGLAALLASTSAAQPVDTMRAVLPWGPYVLADARAVRADPSGLLYVAEAGGRVVVLAEDGSLVRVISGSDRAALVEPVDLDPTNGLVLHVADPGAGRIFRFGRDGFVLESLGGDAPPGHGRFEASPEGPAFEPVAVDSNPRNELFALDRQAGRLYRWDASRQRTLLSGPDAGVLVDPRALAVTEDRLYVLDRDEVVVFDRFGTPVRRFGRAHADEATRIRVLGDRLALVRVDGLALYNREGGLEQVLPWRGAPLRDAALTRGALFLLTAESLHRVER